MQNITSKDNAQVKHVVKLQKSSRYRRQTGLFVAEGLRLCLDAFRSGAQTEALFLTEEALQKYSEECIRLSRAAQKTYLLPHALFMHVCDTQNPQGVLGVIKALDKSAYFDTIENSGKYLVLDNVQDPNNMGTVLRSAEALGISGVILSADCCDVFNPKVVRGSMGAVFRLPVLSVEPLAAWLCQHDALHTYAAVVDAAAENVTETAFETPCAVVIGNEGNGIRSETLRVCRHKIMIPMNGRAESLNASVAAAILMWEMVKQ